MTANVDPSLLHVEELREKSIPLYRKVQGAVFLIREHGVQKAAKLSGFSAPHLRNLQRISEITPAALKELERQGIYASFRPWVALAALPSNEQRKKAKALGAAIEESRGRYRTKSESA